MGVLIDVVLLAWLAASTWWLWRRGPARNLHALAGALIAYSAAFLTAALIDFSLRGLSPNWWLRILVDTLAGSGAFIGCWWCWNRAAAERRDRWSDFFIRKRLLLPGRLLIAAAWVATQIVIATILVNVLASAWPDSTQQWQASITTRHLLGTSLRSNGDTTATNQQRELHDLRTGWAQGVDRLLDATGTRRALAIMDALRWIATLSNEDLAEVVAAEPTLQHVIEEPQLQTVIHDQRLMALVDEATNGSLTAVYALGGEPAIQALIESPRMRDALAAIDPVLLRTRHTESHDDIPAHWAMTAMASSLDLDERLADSSAWTDVAAGHPMQWSGGERYGVIRSAISLSNPATLSLTTAARVSCWIDDELVRLNSADAREANFRDARHRDPSREVVMAAGTRHVVILLDFAGLEVPPSATVRLTQAAATAY